MIAAIYQRFTSPILLLSFFLLTFSPANPAYAETYKWVDENGGLHFTDYPPPEGFKTATKKPAKEIPAPVVSPKKFKAPKVKVKTLPVQKAEKKKLYDLREKVVATEGIDVIVLKSGKKVKYIGVKTPASFLEKNGISERMEKAIAFHDKLVRGKTVTVLLGQRTKDKRGYYLGHVFLGSQSFINAEMIRTGNALTEEYPSDFEYQSLLIRLQRNAQDKGLGIWSF